MFQFRRFPTYTYLIQCTLTEYCSAGFPHSEISGSTAICASPKLIAACHVLHRLLMPRHSPCALYSLTLRDILVLLLELCRQSTGYFRKIVIVTHIFSDVPQLKFTTFSTSVETFCCLAFITFQYIVQFSRCSVSFLLPKKTH